MFSVIKRDLLLLVRDRALLFIIILFPSLLVFLLGNLLARLDNADTPIDPIAIGVTVEASDPFSVAAIDSFTAALEENGAVVVRRVDTYEAARALVDDGEASVAVRFTDPLGIAIYEGFDAIQNRAVDNMMQSFRRQVSSLRALAETAPQRLSEAARVAAADLVVKKEFGYARSMLDYYAVAMLVMILFLGGAMHVANKLYDGRKNGTLRRMLSSPKRRASLYMQTALGSLPQTIIQILCVMATSVLFFGAHYAETWGDNALLFGTFLLVGLAVNAVFMIVGLLIRVNPTIAIMPILWGVMFVSGTFSKEVYIQGVTELSPIWQVQNAAFDLTVFGRGERCLAVCAVCLAVIAVATALGALLFRQKEVTIR